MNILYYDIETSPNIGYTWGKYDQTVNEFIKEREILSVAWKWSNSRTINVLSKRDLKDDHIIVKTILDLFNAADVIVAHNGDEFDYKIVKARALYWGIKPPKVASSVDTLKIAKKHFSLNSNSLNDIAKYLKLGKKVKHEGFELWLKCMGGSFQAWKKMEHYNKQDVRLLEKVYKKFLPYMESHPNLAKLKGVAGCPKCGSEHVQKRGLRANPDGVKQQMQCQSCKGWYLCPKSK